MAYRLSIPASVYPRGEGGSYPAKAFWGPHRAVETVSISLVGNIGPPPRRPSKAVWGGQFVRF